MHTLENELLKIIDNAKNRNISTDTMRILLKERLQDYVLSFIYNHNNYKELVFYGGTCLKKIYGLNRLSEDLDFENIKSISLSDFSHEITKYFKVDLNYPEVDVSAMLLKNIARFTVKLPLMYQLGLSEFDSEKIHVKIEINQNPTGLYPTEKSPYTKVIHSIMIQHYPIDVMMAGKITACIDRVYKKGNDKITVKGRDYYDLLWYMQEKIIPFEQKFIDVNPNYNVKHVFELLDQRVMQIKSSDLLLDLELYFEDKAFIKDWCNNFHVLYERYRENYK